MGFDRQTLERLRQRAAAPLGISVRSALEAVEAHKLRAGLTSLGILFGVASVIAMLAIGKGAEQEILEQMRLLGSNNIMVTPLVEQKEEDAKDELGKQVKKFSPGLTYADAQALARVIPGVDVTSAEVVIVRTRFFTTEDPIGRRIKVGEIWLTVVGVLADRRVSEATAQRLGIRDANMDVYVPVRTMLLRFRNRAQLTQRDIELAAREFDEEATTKDAESAAARQERINRNQLDRIILRAADANQVPIIAEIAQRMLARRHNSVVDFEISVPELLLQQEQRTKTIFNVVLGAIASISLIVGGIGIMNIMLASVLERIREIGVRRAMGATQNDILLQFLSEALLISIAGGVAGILVGAGISAGIERVAGIRTIVSTLSVVVAFGVSISVGIAFGIVPAKRAARQDPVECLRYE